jgi:catechol 2,3-dioxygenase-like lactoylglutathione lyase family enzyme
MIQHVTREVSPGSIDRCVAFYEEIGFSQVPVPPGLAGRAVWLQRGPTQMHLMPTDDAVPQNGHVGVVVDRYGETIARLGALGHNVEPRTEHWGSPRAFVRDPAGNLVEVIAWPPDTHVDE